MASSFFTFGQIEAQKVLNFFSKPALMFLTFFLILPYIKAQPYLNPYLADLTLPTSQFFFEKCDSVPNNQVDSNDSYC